MKFKKLVKTDLEYYQTYISILNVLVPDENRLTNTEIKVLAGFLSLSKQYNDIFSTEARRDIRKSFGISLQSLSNILKGLYKKKFIYKEDGRYKFNSKYIPSGDIKIEININYDKV